MKADQWDITRDKAERRIGTSRGPAFMPLPNAEGGSIMSILATQMVTLAMPAERLGLIGLSVRGPDAALHMAVEADELRHLAAIYLRMADDLDEGRGKQ